MTRKCIRFGNQHQLREAVWLMSEMYRRITTYAPPPLFLQDEEGRMAGKLHAVAIITEMATHLNLDEEGPPADDEELGERLARSFKKPINELAETDVPIASEEDSLESLIERSSTSKTTILPVCNPERRILGLVDEGQIIRALGKALNLAHSTAGNGGEIVEVKE